MASCQPVARGTIRNAAFMARRIPRLRAPTRAVAREEGGHSLLLEKQLVFPCFRRRCSIFFVGTARAPSAPGQGQREREPQDRDILRGLILHARQQGRRIPSAVVSRTVESAG